MASSRATLLLIIAAAAALLPAIASATSYRVGDDLGWDNGGDYDAWAKGKKFKVGDTLEFLYAEGSHNVVLVDSASYASCTAPSNAPTLTSGDDTVTLNQAGRWHFICTFEGHCESGMKLTVNVS